MGNTVTDKINLNEWVVVKTIGGGYLGKVKGFDGLECTPEEFRKNVYSCISSNGWLELFPCFDFMSPLRPVQDRNSGAVSLVRDPIVTAVDFCTEFVPVSVYPSAIVFLADMSNEDKKTYEAFIVQTSKRMTQARLGAAGLVLPDAGVIQRG